MFFNPALTLNAACVRALRIGAQGRWHFATAVLNNAPAGAATG
jgi:hypothetical protein